MNFLAPTAFAFAAAIPVVVLFYLLKRKRAVQVVPSTLLWERFLAETQASAPFQRLRHNWLLILQILLLLLAVFALTRPYFAAEMSGGRLLVVILDASASMKSEDVAPNRFEAAKQGALELVAGMHHRDQMLVVQAGMQTEVKQSASSDKTALRRAIASAKAGDGPTRLSEALRLADSLIQNSALARIHLFSDGAVANLAEFENENLPVEYHKMGSGSANVAVTTMDVRPNPEDPRLRAVFATLKNYSERAAEVQAKLSFEGQVREVKLVTLPPGEGVPTVFVVEQEETGIFTIELSGGEDYLPVDNRASLVSVLPEPIDVLLITSGNGFLERALRSTPDVLLDVQGMAGGAEGYDVVVLDDVSPLEWPEGNVLAFGVANTNWFDSWTSLEGPPIVYTKGNHPLLRFVSFDNVLVAESLGVDLPVWGESLVESPQHTLICAGERERQRICWVGFSILRSTWPWRFSFPIFIQNAMEWLHPASSEAERVNLQTGQPFRFLSDAPDLEGAEIVLPDGQMRRAAINAETGELVFSDTEAQGIYRVRLGTNELAFCANLLDGNESAIAPRDEIRFGEYAGVEAQQVREANLEIWRWIAAGALMMLLFEWWYYHRRTA